MHVTLDAPQASKWIFQYWQKSRKSKRTSQYHTQWQLRAVLDQMLEYGIIQECNEPSLFCSNLLVTKKKDGKSIRVLLDGRLLNNYMQRLLVNLVTHPEIYAQLVGKVWLTVADLSDSFLQMMLKAECQALTTFYCKTHGKRYCFTRCPQGLKNSPLHLKLLLDKLLGDMAQNVIHYADNIMNTTDGTFKEHMEKVGQVLGRLKKGNIKIRPQKISVAKNTVDFLGVVWQNGKISIPEAKLLSFTELPSPTTTKKDKRSSGNDWILPKIHTTLRAPSKTSWWPGTSPPKTIQVDKWTRDVLQIPHRTCKKACNAIPAGPIQTILRANRRIRFLLSRKSLPERRRRRRENPCMRLKNVHQNGTRIQHSQKRGPGTTIHPQDNGLLPEVCSQNYPPRGHPSHSIPKNVPRINRNSPTILNGTFTIWLQNPPRQRRRQQNFWHPQQTSPGYWSAQRRDESGKTNVRTANRGTPKQT